jgi:hypothetical protein
MATALSAPSLLQGILKPVRGDSSTAKEASDMLRSRLMYALVVALLAILCGVSYVLNNPSFDDIAGRWKITKMENVPQRLRFSVTEGVELAIDRRGLLGNPGTPLSILILPDACGVDCYYLHDNLTTVRPRLRKGESSDRLYLYPTEDSVITLDRAK